jgi:hypothetical protein
MGVDLDALRQTDAEIKAARFAGRTQRVKWQKGTWVMRILPPFEGRDGKFYVRVKEAFGVGPNSRTVTPPSQFGDSTDPLMDEISRLKALGDEASSKRASRMTPKMKNHIWLIIRSLNGNATDLETGQAWESKGPHLWSMSNQVFGAITSMILDPDWGDITDPESGRDITVEYAPKEDRPDGKPFPKWTIRGKPNQSQLGDMAWVSEDLFTKHKTGEPSPPEYILACLKGTEEAYFQERRDARDSETEEVEVSREEPASPAPAGSEQSAVEESLEEIRKKNLQKAKKSGLPVDKRHEKDAEPEPETSAELMKADWWAGINGETVKLSGKQVQKEYVDKGHGGGLQLMAIDQEGGWKTALKRGFHPKAKKAKAKKKDKPSPPPPPPDSVRADLEEALS